MDTVEYFLEYVIPSIGVILSNALYIVPIEKMLIKHDDCLADLNPIPYAVAIANALAWVFYGLTIQNHFIYWANAVGVPLSIAAAMWCYPHCGNTVKNQLGSIVLVISSTFVLAIYIAVTFEIQRITASALAVISTSCLYISPLSTMYTVITTDDTATIDPKLTAVHIINAGAWFIYSFVINDYLLLCINSVGVVSGLIQVGLLVWFRGTPVELPGDV